MPTPVSNVETLANQEYKYGFYTDVEADSAPPGLMAARNGAQAQSAGNFPVSSNAVS